MPAGPAERSFQLYANQDAAISAGFGHQLHFKSDFPGSVGGLAVGADVTLHGLKVGEVTDVGLIYDPVGQRIVAPVRYLIEPSRIGGAIAAVGLPPGTVAARLVKQGLRATLQAANLITGQKVVALDFFPDAPAEELREEGGVFIMPTTNAGGFDTLQRSASELLSKINRIDFDKIGNGLAGVTEGLDSMINGPELKRALTSLEGTMAEVHDMTRKLDAGVTPALRRLPEMTAQLQDTLTKANRMVGSMNDGYGQDSKFHRDLDRLLPQLTDALRSMRALSDLLQRHPEALIRGRTNQGTE